MQKNYKNLSKLNTGIKSIQKTSSEAAFDQFLLDFGIPRPPQNHQKCRKKQAEKMAKT